MNKLTNCVKQHKCLTIAIALILVGSVFGMVFNTSFFYVNVSRISFETERGTLHGLLYMPRGAGPNDPRPVIITTHGFLNSAEMQDAPAIEMSRRGYIVLALDMYDHGNSRWAAPILVGGHFATFWIHSQFDAARYMFEQPFTLRDENGNGIIAVSGHSMGGFSSMVAVYFDEMNYLQTGYRMIHSAISVGADLSHSSAVAPPDRLIPAMGPRTIGFVGGLYDEFFFNAPEAVAEAGGSVIRYDWTTHPVGQMLLGEPGTANQWHWGESGDVIVDDAVVRESMVGLRIIYTPAETHPWNHFSATTTGYLIDFYYTAFAGHTSNVHRLRSVFEKAGHN